MMDLNALEAKARSFTGINPVIPTCVEGWLSAIYNMSQGNVDVSLWENDSGTVSMTVIGPHATVDLNFYITMPAAFTG